MIIDTSVYACERVRSNDVEVVCWELNSDAYIADTKFLCR